MAADITIGFSSISDTHTQDRIVKWGRLSACGGLAGRH
jgi:hypothetical protein